MERQPHAEAVVASWSSTGKKVVSGKTFRKTIQVFRGSKLRARQGCQGILPRRHQREPDCKKISSYIRVTVEEGKPLPFLDEIQECPKAIMTLRFFKEDYPELHVIAACSLLEFTLQEFPAFRVGRINSLFMYPMTFDEFLGANHEDALFEMRNKADSLHPLDIAFHDKLVKYFHIYLLVGEYQSRS